MKNFFCIYFPIWPPAEAIPIKVLLSDGGAQALIKYLMLTIINLNNHTQI